MASPAVVTFDVFLSYNRADRPAVKTIARRLVDRETIAVWFDEWNLVPGTAWQPGIEKALGNCRSVAVLVGPSGVSPWQNEEMRAAINRRVQETNGLFRLIPVLLPGAKKEAMKDLHFLSAATWVEFDDSLDDEWALHRLVCGIRGLEPGAALPNRSLRQRYFFVIDGTVDEIDQSRIEAIVECLRKYSGDATLTLREVKEGSVRLLLEGTRIGFERLRFLAETGQLHELLGSRITRLEPLPTMEQPSPAAKRRKARRQTLSKGTAKAADVLFISRSPRKAETLAQMLRGLPLTIDHIQTVADLRATVESGWSGVVVTETELPDGDWRTVLATASHAPRGCEVIVTDPAADARLWCEVLNSGAYDLLAQPFYAPEVRRILYNAARRPALLSKEQQQYAG